MRIDLSVLAEDIASEFDVLEGIWSAPTHTFNGVVDAIKKAKRIYLAGCGDSYFSALYGQYLLMHLGIRDVYAYNAHEYLHYVDPSEDDLLIAISASGKTSATVLAAKKSKENGGKTIGLTFNPKSPLANCSDLVLSFSVRDSVVSPTKTSIAFLAILHKVAYLATNGKHKPEQLRLPRVSLDITENILYFVGGGFGLPTAYFGMAKARELLISHSNAFELEEFLHYGNLVLDKNSFVFVYSDSRSYERSMDLRELLEYLGVNYILIHNKEGGEGIAIRVPDDLFTIASLMLTHKLILDLAIKKHGDSVEVPHGYKVASLIRIRGREPCQK